MKILVTAASKHGSTGEIADAIAAQLGKHGLDVVRADPDAVDVLTGFDGVVLGSAVYAGHWLKPALEFAERHAAELDRLPVWLFSSGPIAGKPTDEAPPPGTIEARSYRVFAGRLDRSLLGFGERTIAKAVRAPDGDFRDWVAVGAWADEIAATLTLAGV